MEPVNPYDVEEDIKKYEYKCKLLGINHLRFEVEKGSVIVYGIDSRARHIIIPSFVDKIGDGAFKNYTDLESITINCVIKSVGEDAFNNCIKLKRIELSYVDELGRSAFRYCKSLESVLLSDEIEMIPTWAFDGCIKLKEINMPKNLVYIEDGAFSNTGITKISLPDNVYRVSMLSFGYCERLEEIRVNKNITEISVDSFKGCDKLNKAYLPNKKFRLHKKAFDSSVELIYK